MLDTRDVVDHRLQALVVLKLDCSSCREFANTLLLHANVDITYIAETTIAGLTKAPPPP